MTTGGEALADNGERVAISAGANCRPQEVAPSLLDDDKCYHGKDAMQNATVRKKHNCGCHRSGRTLCRWIKKAAEH